MNFNIGNVSQIKNEYSLIQTMAIRSMAKATYDVQNIGHYGLAFENYTHFTSPIRRYADLVVHRVVMEELTSKINKGQSAVFYVQDELLKYLTNVSSNRWLYLKIFGVIAVFFLVFVVFFL